MSRGAPPRYSDTFAKYLEGRGRRRGLVLPEPEPLTTPPTVCTKPGCGGRVFIPHEEGWQCFNCMKIVYRRQPPGLFGVARR